MDGHPAIKIHWGTRRTALTRVFREYLSRFPHEQSIPVMYDSQNLGEMMTRSANLRRGRPIVTGVCALLGGLIISSPPPASASLPDEEMIITARKKEELLIETPLAVTAFGADTITDLGLNRIDDLARHTPGFSFNSGLGRQPTSDRPMIRGLTTVRNGIANASAATVFIDGIYIGGSSQSTELYNLERAEILRGPQAALYGRNTYAGAINYVTRGPTDDFAGEIRMTGAEHDTTGLTGWFSGPIVDGKLGFVITAGHRQYGGEYRNIRDGSSVGGEQSDDITAKLRWTPTNTLDITFKAGLQKTDDEHYAVFLQGRELNNCCFRTAEAPRAREYFVGEAQKDGNVNLYTDLLEVAGGVGNELERHLMTLNLDWDFANGYTLTSLTGYVDDESRNGSDISYAAYDPLPFFPPHLRGSFTKVNWLEQSDLSQELRLSSPDSQALNWTTGLYYYQGEARTVASNQVYVDNTNQIIVNPVMTPLSNEKIENFAVFGGVDWKFLEYWTATAEMRWATDRISVRNTGTPTPNVADTFTQRFKSLTPRFTLSYAATEDMHYYLNVAKGTKPGDFNSKVPDEKYRAVDEESVWNYEIGAKGRWWQQRIAANMALFYLDVEDQQLTQIVELPDGSNASIIQNVGRTSVFGIETELGAAVTENFSVDVTYAWTRAEYREHISTDEADLRGWNGCLPTPGAPCPEDDDLQLLGDVSGNLVPRVPEHMASLVMRYELPFSGERHWYISGDYTFESSRFAQEHNLIETGNRNLVGLRTGFDTGHWEASLWVTNLLNDDTPVDIQRYIDRQSGSLPRCSAFFPNPNPDECVGSSSSPRGFVVTLPRGRQVGATISYQF